MTIDEIKKEILNLVIIKQGKTQINISKKLIPDRLMNEILVRTINCRDNISERLYWILNNIENYFLCLKCNRIFTPRFYGHKKGYIGECCSRECAYGYENRIIKISTTHFERTGFSHHFKNPEIKNNMKITNLLHWDVENPSQNLEIHKKQQKHRTKKMELPSGKIINFQGYENVAINHLLKSIDEKDLINGNKDIPEIWYNSKSGLKRYYPDLYIPGKNLIIEVKSTWTYEKYLESNILKRQGCIDLGYNFEFWICSKKEILKKIKLGAVL